MAATIGARLAAAVAADPTRPLFTWYDDASGDRTELSGATLANWVAKTANLLADGAGVAPGDPVVVDLPAHWQAAAVLLGAWSTGAVVTPAGGTAAVAFAAQGRAATYVGRADEVYGLALAPMAMPMRDAPPGVADYVIEVRVFGDHHAADPTVTGDSPAAPDATHSELLLRAAQRAADHKMAAGDRVLIDAGAYPDPLDWLLAPLVAGASVILCANLDPAALPRRQEAERVTLTL